MKSIAAYVRNLLGWGLESPSNNQSFKRNRNDDDQSSDDDVPAYKRIKQLTRSHFPEVMASDDWETRHKPSKVRYVPIQVESGHPSTSTPIESPRLASRVKSTPVRLVSVMENGDNAPSRTSRGYASVEPVLHVIDDDQDLTSRKKSLPRFVDITDNGDDEPRSCNVWSRPTYHTAAAAADNDDQELQTRLKSFDKLGNRVRTLRLSDMVENGDRTVARTSRSKDVFDDDHEVKWVKSTAKKKSTPKYIQINLDDDDEDEDSEEQDDDVIFVKKVKSPTHAKPYKYFVSKNDQHISEIEPDETPHYLKLSKGIAARNKLNSSPRLVKKFTAPAGVTKCYRKSSTPVPRWMQTFKINNSQQSTAKSRFSNINSNTRSALAEVFNLDEKLSYQELIKQVTRGKSLVLNRSVLDRSQKKPEDLEKGKEIVISSDSEVEVVPSESSTASCRIEPVNSLRDSYKENKKYVVDENWVEELQHKYNKKSREQSELLSEQCLESDLISKVVGKQSRALVEHRLKQVLSLPEGYIKEAPAALKLPELSPEQEKLVDRALGPGPSGQLLVEKFNLRIHRRDLQTLSGTNWLNEEVINFYMNLLMQRSEKRRDLPRVYAANTFFYPKLMQAGQAGLKRWTRKVDIFSHELMAVPVHLGVHWCMALIHFPEKKINYLDSMGGRNQACLHALMQYLKDEHQDKKGKPFDDSGWKTECLQDIPQQMNGSDCGMFACTFAEFSARKAEYTFTQEHMPYLRRKAALEILLGRLML